MDRRFEWRLDRGFVEVKIGGEIWNIYERTDMIIDRDKIKREDLI